MCEYSENNGRQSGEPKRVLRRGVNIGNTFEVPDEDEWKGRLKKEHFSMIKGAGFDFVRIPVCWPAQAEREEPYLVNPGFLQRVDWAVQQALDNHLAVIIDMHHYHELMKKPEFHKKRFLSLWRQISDHYKDYPKDLYFELLHEPFCKLSSDIWNQYLTEGLEIIRAWNADRTVVIGPVLWNSISELGHLKLPRQDKNLMAVIHYYSPFKFTHQGAEWVDNSQKWVGTRWTGSCGEKEAVRRDFYTAAQWAKENDIKLLLGEFGSYNKGDMASRVRWTSFVSKEAERHGMAWCYWEFYASFGIYDPDAKQWRTELLEALVPKHS